MHRASEVLAAGANFELLGPNETMLKATVPVVAVCAVRTGSGKSQTTREVAETLEGRRASAWWPFATRCRTGTSSPSGCSGSRRSRTSTGTNVTIEEREEYEPHITHRHGRSTRASTTATILEQAQAECDVLLWDGGNNDLPFYRPDVHIVVADPLRAGHETTLPPRRGQPAHGRRDRDQQDGLGRARAGRQLMATIARAEPDRDRRQGEQPRHGRRSRGDRAASGCS